MHTPVEPLESRIAPAFAPVFELSTLDGSNGFKLSGGAAYDLSGFSVSDAGDVNGDGFGDLIIGALAADPNGEASGASYVVFGKASGFAANLNLLTLNGSDGFKVSGVAPHDYSGWSVSGAGDINGDGFDDLIIGARAADPNGFNSGAAYLVFGKVGGFAANLDLSTLDGSNGFMLSGAAAGDTAGWSVSAAGDVNGDGFSDLIIGARYADPNNFNGAGASYVVFGKATGFVANLNLSTLNGSNGLKLSGVAASDYSGYSVSGAGDVNGDGFGDLIIGASQADPNGISSGASYVVFGKARWFVANLNLSTLNGSNGFKVSGAGEGDQFGTSVSAAGDINGDGFGDVIIGARYADPNGFASGASYVVFGKASGFAANLNLSGLNGSNGFKLSGGAAYDGSGFRVSTAGDLNGDGFDELIIGAPNAAPNGSRSGASYVVFGKASGFAANLNLSTLNGSDGFKLSGVRYDASGRSVSAAGDVNDDGFDDVIIGAPSADPNRSGSGASYVVFGRGPTLSISDASVAEGEAGMTALQFTVSLSEAAINPVVVGLATNDGTALAGSDYTAVQTKLVFALGELTKTVTVNLIGDTLYEADETISITIDSQNAVIRQDTAIGTILNDDAPPVVSIAGGSVIEGDSGTTALAFTVSLSAASGVAASLQFASADGNAIAGSDYMALAPGTVVLAPGETTKTIPVQVLGDTSIEDHETFSVVLSNASGATLGAGTATGTIFNDDTTLRIAGPTDVLEGDSGAISAVFTVSLEKESALPVTVSYVTEDGTATGGSDYTAIAPTQVTFAPGETSKTINVEVLGDTEVEAHESFSVILSDAANAAVAIGAAMGTILNDDTLVRIGDESLLEGHSGTRALTFTVSLSAESALSVSISFASMEGTATEGSDYIGLGPGTLVFAPGETSKTIGIDVLGDTTVEASETFSIALSNATNAVIDDFTAIGTILDDDVTLTGKHSATFTDVDGELVAIKVSKGTLKVEDFTIVPSGLGAQLALIDIRGKTEFAGANLSVRSKAVNGVAGDGLANVGYLNAAGIDLGKIVVIGDLGRIDAGDGDAAKPAVGSLNIANLGTHGLLTQDGLSDSNLHSIVDGDLRKLKIKADIGSGVTLNANGRLGSLRIGGNVDGAKITALGVLNPRNAASAIAIAQITIGGNITDSQILAGYDSAGAGRNADAAIGKVIVGGAWTASDLVAGATAGADGLFGTEDDALISGGGEVVAKIASVQIKGIVTGTATSGDHFGFVAQEVGAFQAAGAKVSLNSGPGNDLTGMVLGPTMMCGCVKWGEIHPRSESIPRRRPACPAQNSIFSGKT
jgi:hypothetical protein